MKIKSFLMLIPVMLAVAACSSSGGQKASTTNDSTVLTNAETQEPPEFKPFDIVERSLTVKDYALWRPLFNSDSTSRKESGMELIVVGRGLEQHNELVTYLKVTDLQKAKAYFANPRLKPLMEKAGILSKPNTEFFHVIRFDSDAKEKQWVTITHKVKDFDAWLKVFDTEGSATRATFGLQDVVLARGIEDQNLVFIVFDIKDMIKAKARMGDPALQKLMMDAGVEGPPKIRFYADGE
jgi:hypothetical protein